MTTIVLPCFGIVVEIDGKGAGSIESKLKYDIPDKVNSAGWEQSESYEAAVDGIESLIMAHACAGIDITTPAYLEGIETAVEAVTNHFS